MRQILITGAFGFVGSNLVCHYLQQGWTVRILDLPRHPLKDTLLRYFQKFGKTHLYEADICDLAKVRDAVRGCDEVIHVAALLNSVAPYYRFHRVNVEGTQTVCEACMAEQVSHLTLISTSDVFGIPGPNHTISENSPFKRWQEPYADTKIEAAQYVRRLREQGRLSASIIYPGWVYGEGDRQFFPAVMDMVRGGAVFTWHRSEPTDIYFVHIKDLVNGISMVIDTPDAANRDYLLLDQRSGVSVLDFYNMIAGYLGIKIRHVHLPYSVMMTIGRMSQTLARFRILPKPLLSTTDVKAFGNPFRFSTKRAATELGWTPTITTQDGILSALEWQTSQLDSSKM